MQYIIFGLCGLIILTAAAQIIKTIERSGPTGESEKNKDFISLAIQRKKEELERRPWNMDFSTYTTVAAVSVIVFAAFAYAMFSSWLIVVVVASLGLFVPEVIIAVQEGQQKAAFEARYATALKALSSALKSGLSIHQAVSDICDSAFVHETVRKEFRKLDADLKMGLSIQTAFERFSDRVDSEDAKDVATAISLQNKVGGREAQVVETITRNISSRIMLRKEINSMFAGSSVTIVMLDIIPFLVVGLLLVASSYLRPFFEIPILTVVFIALMAVMCIGSFVMRKVVDDMKKECGVK